MSKSIKTGSILFPLSLVILACCSCTKEVIMDTTTNNTTQRDTMKPTTVSGVKYLALGDSYTIGHSVPENDRFPAQAVQILSAQNISVTKVQYIATSGWTTASLMNAIDNQSPATDWDIVTLLIGVNDQYQGIDTSVYRTRFTALLNTSIGLAANRPSRVFVLSIPDYSATPFVNAFDKERVSKEIDAFNSINKEISDGRNIQYIDITPGSRDATVDPSLIANDNLHPSRKEYAKWAMALAQRIKSVVIK